MSHMSSAPFPYRSRASSLSDIVAA